MKKIISLLTLLACGAIAFAQEPASSLQTEKQLADLDSVFIELYNNEEYVKASNTLDQALEIIKATRGEADSSYINTLVLQSRCYYKARRLAKAIDTVKRAIELYGNHISKEDRSYAVLHDNLSVFQSANGENKEALENGLLALAAFERMGINDNDMAYVLSHVAEYYYNNGKHPQAITTELRALNIIRSYHGERSQEYIDELNWLKRYYESNEEQKKADDLQERIDKLTEEVEAGYIDMPDENITFETVEDCNKYTREVLRCCKYLFGHYMTAPQMTQAANVITKWSISTDQVHIGLGEAEEKLAEASGFYISLYVAGCSEYALEEEKPDFSIEMYRYAYYRIIEWYAANREKDIIKENSFIEKLIKAAKKDKLNEVLDKQYPTPTDEKQKIEYKF